MRSTEFRSVCSRVKLLLTCQRPPGVPATLEGQEYPTPIKKFQKVSKTGMKNNQDGSLKKMFLKASPRPRRGENPIANGIRYIRSEYFLVYSTFISHGECNCRKPTKEAEASRNKPIWTDREP